MRIPTPSVHAVEVEQWTAGPAPVVGVNECRWPHTYNRRHAWPQASCSPLPLQACSQWRPPCYARSCVGGEKVFSRRCRRWVPGRGGKRERTGRSDCAAAAAGQVPSRPWVAALGAGGRHAARRPSGGGRGARAGLAAAAATAAARRDAALRRRRQRLERW